MFNIILAIDSKNGISKNGKIPWKILEDMEYFKQTTTNPFFKNVVIMGYNTWKSTPFLKNRENIVISNTPSHLEELSKIDNIKAYDSLDSALKNIDYSTNVWIIGGRQLFNSAIIHPLLNNIYITKIFMDYECDNFVRLPLCKTISSSPIYNRNGQSYQFNIYSPCFDLETQYLRLCKKILLTGVEADTRNGMTKSIFGESIKFSLEGGEFPLLTTKKMFFRGIVEELLFFIRGDTNTKKLEEKGINIWRPNTNAEFLRKCGLDYSEGEMGPMYGYQWRNFNGCGVDQLKEVVRQIIDEPTSRRIIMTDYNPLQAHLGVLYPCHSLILQFNVVGEYLDCQMYQRSADTFLGLPFNIASTSLLLILISKITHKTPRNVIINMGDVHIYQSHYSAVETQLQREPYDLPTLELLKPVENIVDLENLCFSDFAIHNYKSYPAIKADMVA
jgi:dihydrofolate reductase/thymidylate synthase